MWLALVGKGTPTRIWVALALLVLCRSVPAQW